MSRKLLNMTEALVAEGCLIPMDVAANLMSYGYIVEGMEARIDGFRVIDDIVNEYEETYE